MRSHLRHQAGCCGLLMCQLLLVAGTALSQEKGAATPEQAVENPDFQLQGEYVSEATPFDPDSAADSVIALQVVALGDGLFRVVIYNGGLPGAGWDRTPPRIIEEDDADGVRDLIDALSLVKTERRSPTLGASPPAGAIVLFDGTRATFEKQWIEGARMTEDGLLMEGATSVESFRDFTAHVEFRTPFMPHARGQARGNSGIYFQGRYETQILDSFGLEGKHNEMGGIYEIRDPDLNMCFPPLAWQTYDVDFVAARWDEEGNKRSDARMTVRLNGVVVHRDVDVSRATRAAPRDESPEPGPLFLQNHGDPVRFRNIWIVPRDADREARRPRIPGFERFHALAEDPREGGLLLAGELGCVHCHRSEQESFHRVEPKQAPILSNVGQRVRPEWMMQFLAEPQSVKPGTTMPSLFSGWEKEERNEAVLAIVHFLASTGRPAEQDPDEKSVKKGEKLYHEIGCLACHAPRHGKAQVSQATSVPLEGIEEKYTVPSLSKFLKNPHAVRPSGRMPALHLNDNEAGELAQYLLSPNTRGSVPTARNDDAEADETNASHAFGHDPSLIERGQELFVSIGCANCHEMERDGERVKPDLSPRPLHEVARSDESESSGCLAEAPASSSKRPVPDFALSPAQQRALSAIHPGTTDGAGDAPLRSDESELHRTMAAYNCYACHARGSLGGPESDRDPHFLSTQHEMGDEGRIPPPLDGVGDKLRDDWLKQVLTNGATDRPYMKARMPRFGPETAHLAELFARLDRIEDAQLAEFDDPVHRVKSTGRQLVGEGGLACIKCHTFGSHEATGIQAISLTGMSRRIREDWFLRYLYEPARYRPGTRMPTGFPDGKAVVRDLYDGDPHMQISAIWTYLTDGDKAGIPDGLIAEMIELVPGERPIVYRNFIEGLSTRGIAVGYPERAHLAWDADDLCLKLVWHGRFMDASRHWSARGQGWQPPLGDHILSVEPTVPVARLESRDSPWPADSPRAHPEYRFIGYQLNERGQPTFTYGTPLGRVLDFPEPVAGTEGEGTFRRELSFQLAPGAENGYFRAAVGRKIERTGDGYRVDDGLTIRISGGGEPVLRNSAGRKELLVPLLFNGEAKIIQELIW